MTISEIDKLLSAFKVEYYSRGYANGDRMATCSSKIEIVFLSQWAVASGIALSKAAGNPRYRREIEGCYERLKSDIPNLFAGLTNGVAVGPNMVAPAAWISSDGNAAPAYKFFMLNCAGRFTEYADAFASGTSGSLDESLSRVAGKAMSRIFDAVRQPKLVAEFADPDAPSPGASDVYEIIRDGIKRFIQAEIEKTIDLIDG